MKAAIVTGPGKTPIYGDFNEPEPKAGEELIHVSASALSQLTKGRASGAHYSSSGQFPAVVGVDGVGRTTDGRRVYFVLPQAPFGAMAERAAVRREQCIPLPDGVDDVTAAAIANPGMSSWAAREHPALQARGKIDPSQQQTQHPCTRPQRRACQQSVAERSERERDIQ